MDWSAVNQILLLLLTAGVVIRSYDVIANCRSPLGMESGKIADGALEAFSKFGDDFGPQRARLHLDQPPRGYRADAASVDVNGTWIKVALGKETVVTGISTQGFGDITLKEWVTKYTFSFSSGSSFFPFKETSGAIKNFTGNSDINGVQHHDVPLPVITSTVMVTPLEWNNNVGLRMELYGCAPGYYFLARFIVDSQPFILAFLDKEREDYKTWKDDTLIQIKLILQYVPGFLDVKFRRFRLASDLDTLSAEVEIHCIKEATKLITDKLNKSVGPAAESMFASKIDFVYPAVDSSCSFPEVDIHLNQTITTPTEVLTTSNVTLHADITLCNSQIKSVLFATWKTFITGDKTLLTGPLLEKEVIDLDKYVFNPPRFCKDCYPAYLYVWFTAELKELDGGTLDGFGFLKIVQPPLVANISSPTEAKKGVGADVVLNASNSHDPDILSEGTWRFTWFCSRTKDTAAYKEECQYGRKVANGSLFYVHVNKLKSDHTYVFNLTVSKGNRNSFVTRELKILPAVNFSFRCTDCGNKIVQSKCVTLIPECKGQLCKNVTMTTWSIYANEPASSGKQWKRIADKNVSGLSSPPIGFVEKQLASHSTSKTRDPFYKIKAIIVIEIRAKNDVTKEEHSTIVQLNSPPFVKEGINNGCFVEPDEGYAVETTFNITCAGWQDEDKPLTYEFRYNTSVGLVINDPIISAGVDRLSTKLPVGDLLSNFQFPVDIHIKDSLGDLTVKRVKVKVKEKYSGDVNKTMYRIANNEPNKLKDLIKNGEHEKACDLAISVLSVLENRNQSSQRDDERDNLERRVRSNIIEEIRHVEINSKERLSKVSTVVAMATKDKIPLDSQVLALQKLDEGIDYLSKLTTNNTEDAGTLTKQVNKKMLLGLGNILKMSSKNASSVKVKMIAQRALEMIWRLRDFTDVDDNDDDEPLVNVYPKKSSCSFPEVDIYINQTMTTEVFITSQVSLYADIMLCNTRVESIQSSRWEMFVILDKASLTGQFVTIAIRDRINTSAGCYRAYPYVHFTAHFKELSSRTLDGFGFLKISQPSLVANITGPKEAKKRFGANIVLNASYSYDPDSLNEGTLRFTWLCKRKRSEVFEEGCKHVRTAESGRWIFVNINRLKSKHTYEFKLMVSKGNRTSFAIHKLKVLPFVYFSFSCAPNCGNKIRQSGLKRLTLIPECPLCKNVTMTTWSIHLNEPTSNGKQWKRIDPDKNVSGLSPPPSSFVAKQLASHSITKTRDPVYKIKATIWIQARNDVIKEENSTKVRLNSPPFTREGISKACFVEPKEGFAIETTFNITCVGWQDEDEPLTYEFRYNTSAGLVVNDPIKENTLSTKLPVGFKSSELPVHVYIRDSFGDYSISRVKVKVSSKLFDDANHTVYQIANREPNIIKHYVNSSQYSKACDFAISVLSLFVKGNQSKINDVKGNLGQKVRIEIIDLFIRVEVTSKELLSKVSNVLAMATKDEIPLESQEKALKKLVEGIDYLSKLITNNSENAGTLTKQISKNMLLGLGNILKMSSAGASFENTEKDTKKSKNIAQETLKTVWRFRNLITIERDADPLVFTSDFLSMVVNRPSQTNVNRTTVDKTNFTLPKYGNLLSALEIDKKDITSKIVLFKSNPYTWHKSASAVKSWVIDVVLQKDDQTKLNISGLKDPVQLYIPQNSSRAPPLAAKANTDQYFVKPSFNVNDSTLMQYHEIDLAHHRAVVFVKLKPEISTYTPLRVYVSFSDFPTPTKHDFSTVIPNCVKPGDTKEDMDCVNNPKSYVFSFTASDTGHVGIHYIGIHYYVKAADDVTGKEEGTRSSNDSTIKKRIRKSCGDGSRRQKRSCVGVKDPPPSPTPPPRELRPTYNASTDLKYNLSVNIGSCLYWSEDEEQWTDEGCNVTSDVVSDSIHCLCNHLSAFGGDFFVAPNRIEIKKVFSEVSDLAKNKNFAVLTTICTILVLYVIGLIFTRQADKRDKLKTIPNVCLPDGEEYGVCHYHISIATGMWMGSGTTANVGLMIYGEDLCSGKIILNDSNAKKTFFARASVNTFTVSLPRSLGPIYKIEVWHDNTGNSPGWFLLDVIITELESEQKWYFMANRWLAVEKASGEIELAINASNKQELSKFKNLFYSRASKRLADGHLWISVLTRPPQSSFTRTQRLSSCMSVLFCAMITNAMFYDKEEDAEDTFQIGPLAMSWTQVKIGIQSALIAFPVNVIIVAIFRNVKPKKQQNKDSKLFEENSRKGLPHCVIYIAWILCILAILSSSFFIVLYSMSWGRTKSNKWLTSIIVSFIQDIIILQPIQVVLIASLLSILVRKPIKHDPVHGLPHQKNPSENDSNVQPPEESELKRSRTFWLQLRKMFRSLVEIILFIVFALLLFVVCYGNRDSSRYNLTRSLKDVFPEFDNRVNSTPTFWNWTREKLVPGVFFSKWYNEEKVELQEGFISSGYPFLVGMPRFRQIRVKTDSCQIEDLIEVKEVKRCLPYYSSMSEERTPYSLRDWTPVTNISTFRASFKLNDLCPKPWRYQTAEALATLTFKGFYAAYDGGGYIADLGYNAETALGVINDLESNGWIDDRTVAVFIEFTVYEPSSTLFSAAKYLYERYPTGGTKTTVTIDTLMIYYPVDPIFRSFYLICQLILVLFTFGLFVGEIIKLYCQGCSYFTHFWNFVDILLITVAVVAMTQYFLKAKYTSDFVRRVRKNPFETSSSDYIVQWCHLEIWLLSFVVFLVTIKMLRLIKFNHHICHLTHTVKSAVRHLASYSLVFTGTLVAYTQLGTLLFGSSAASYSNMARSLTMLLERLLGNNMYTSEVKAENDVTGQLFTFAYSVSIAMILINMFLTILNASYIEVRLLKQGRYPDVDLAQFAWQYLLQKAQTYWNDAKRSFKSVKEPKVRLKRRNAKYFSVRNANVLHDSDRYFCTKYDENRSASYRLSEEGSAEECISLSPAQFQYVDEIDDIDMVDEFTSLKDIKKTVLQIGTSFFLYKNQWSSTSLDSDDDAAEASSLRSEWSRGSESDQSLLAVNVMENLEDDRDIDEFELTKEVATMSGNLCSTSSNF